MSEPTVTRAPEPDGPTVSAAGAQAGAPTDDARHTAPTGYELHTLIGSGGMGAVYRARDLDLARNVAVKFLHARYAPDSVAAWRFTEEARITAKLAHPGIPPVHRVGLTAEGRPFLAMKLIKGETLDELLKARKALADNRSRFIGIFEQIAQAVGFAHAQRIIHRDLKPANVMVGDFGEVQVMDWGLAKELSGAPSAEPKHTDATLSVESHIGRDGTDATQAGSLLGTPAYMPPEQAAGAVELVTERADVFGLGAILCVVLTGKPPFVADTSESARLLAARGKLEEAFARLDSCGAEPELIALAKRCLAPEANDRPASAGEVATAVAAFRADAERRARQAEMDRATAKVKETEERKRRRVQWMLALAVFATVAVAGIAGWWIDSERASRRAAEIKTEAEQKERDNERRAEQRATEIKTEAEQKQRDAERRARELVTFSDVSAAVREVNALREEGSKQVDDTHRWGLTLTAARSALKRAEALVAAGEPTPAVRTMVEITARGLTADDRDRTLIVELDRIEEENDIRFLIPISLSRRPSDRYSAAFRTHGIDIATVPHETAVAWLKAHRFRQRLTAAIRHWQHVPPPTDPATFFIPPPIEVPAVLPAVGGQMGTAAVTRHKPLSERLRQLADAVTEDPFVREWWSAVAKKDRVALTTLLDRPEFARLSSGELSTLAEGLFDFTGRNETLLRQFLTAAYERFPGDFWVNFRLAELLQVSSPGQTEAERLATSLRYVSAAVAARPRSAIARVSLAATLWERNRGDATAIRIARGAIELDPTSAWPHMFLAFMAQETGNWDGYREGVVGAVRADADTAFLMASNSITDSAFPDRPDKNQELTNSKLDGIVEAMIAARPDHPGGYDLRAGVRYSREDYAGALADYRKAKATIHGDYLRGPVVQERIDYLERLQRWKEKLPTVLRGEVKPTTTEYEELAEYCAGFEQNYALAARFAGEVLSAQPDSRPDVRPFSTVVKYAGWAVRAARGDGVDADLTADRRAGLRRQALAWLRVSSAKLRPELRNVFIQEVWMRASLASVREPERLAKLPPEERIAWEKFWKDMPNPFPPEPDVAPPPRESKQANDPPSKP